MADYVDKSAQTIIAGLTKFPSPHPPMLFDATTTPPDDDMSFKELQFPSGAPTISKTSPGTNTSPSLLLRRKNRPALVARISLPSFDIGNENPRSPPPTEAVMSPLPAANRLHAGHTPIFPRSLSPLRTAEESAIPTPQQDDALEGPLTLPAQPGDGSGETIELKVLVAELAKIARKQNIEGSTSDFASKQTTDHGEPNSRQGSLEDRRRSSAGEVEVVDGVILKKPKMNMGAPLGQA